MMDSKHKRESYNRIESPGSNGPTTFVISLGCRLDTLNEEHDCRPLTDLILLVTSSLSNLRPAFIYLTQIYQTIPLESHLILTDPGNWRFFFFFLHLSFALLSTSHQSHATQS
ncbi:hypothetical protein BU23DRAFT_293681 [Bimuria novae-zelandiae CBS 107.79]|uniref:Uncharacterized protein n=1 Tax=Bimuria novae-zelandiae CBS 107.79 TaxID=1447943 RepID=A0A6A5VJ90_9PLEO|nr:hypothetical protein BU23DRAFT_293681 [Bimuria novae-zelandiae CBS 107.79]